MTTSMLITLMFVCINTFDTFVWRWHIATFEPKSIKVYLLCDNVKFVFVSVKGHERRKVISTYVTAIQSPCNYIILYIKLMIKHLSMSDIYLY